MPKKRDAKPDWQKTYEQSLFFNGYGSFEEVFPTVQDITLRIEEWDRQQHEMVVRHFNREKLKEFAPCLNPLCKHGGIPLAQEVHTAVREGATEKKFGGVCHGSESMGPGNPRKRCYKTYTGSLRIVYSGHV